MVSPQPVRIIVVTARHFYYLFCSVYLESCNISSNQNENVGITFNNDIVYCMVLIHWSKFSSGVAIGYN